MKTLNYLLIISILISCQTKSQTKNDIIMESRFFTTQEFNENFGKEMVSSQEVFENMKNSGLKEYQFCQFDFDYISDSKEKLDSLREFFIKHYGYEMKETKKIDGNWNLWGNATKFPVDSDNILFWALDLYIKGFRFDCKLNGYGAVVEKPDYPDLVSSKADYYFDEALKAYNNQNTGLAIIHWSTVIKIDPNNPDSFYSRAIAKNELFTWKAALKDYDKAIELAPDFFDALVNRGATRDEAGDFKGAIEDYNKAIEIKPYNSMAYFNRGNTKLNMGDKTGACSDWTKAKELGADYADEIIKNNCN